MMKLNCSFPWVPKSKTYSKCGSKHRVMNLINLINDVNLRTPTIIKELNGFGCLQQNCHQTNWEISSTQKIKLGFRQQGLIYLKFTFPSSKKIAVMEESLAYTYLDLLADIGGYAGIFVGASIITLYDATLKLLSNLTFVKQHLTK